MTTVAVIILNWNRPGDTIDCLHSILNSSVDGIKINLVVVDNASTDDSRSRLKKYLKENTRTRKSFSWEIIKNKYNLGFVGGNNVGIAKTMTTIKTGDFIFLLNNDTVVDKNVFVDLLKSAKDSTYAGIFSPKIYFAKGYEFKKNYKAADLGKIIWSAGGLIDWQNVYGANRGVDEVDRGQFNTLEETDFATGAAMFVRFDVIKDIGMLDEKYFMYFEDTDFCMRAKSAGWQVVYAPPATVWHKVAQSSAIGGDLNDYFTTRNRLLFGFRYAGVRARFALYRESLRHLLNGRKWQKHGVRDFYLRKFGRGSLPVS